MSESGQAGRIDTVVVTAASPQSSHAPWAIPLVIRLLKKLPSASISAATFRRSTLVGLARVCAETLCQTVLRARFGLPPGEITPLDAGHRLREAGVDGDLANACSELLEVAK